CSSDNIHLTADCLRNKTVTELISQTSLQFDKNEFYGPVYGDEVLPLAPVEALRNGTFNRGIDIIYGTAENEGSFFMGEIFPKLLQENANLTVESVKQDIEYLIRERLLIDN